MFRIFRKSLVAFLVILLLTCAVLAGCAQPEAAAPTTPTTPATPTTPTPVEKIQITWGHTAQDGAPSPDSHFYPMYSRFKNDVVQNTGGKVEFVELVGAVTAPDMYDSLIAGTVDMVYQVIIVNTGRFPTLEMATVTDYFTQCKRPSTVFQIMYNEFPEIQNEFSEVKVVAIFGTPPTPPGIGFATIDKPVRTLEDAKGMKLGQYGEWGTKEVAALGFTPVAVPPWEVYEAMQRGLVDGSNMDIVFLDTQKVGEIAKYWHPLGFIYCPFHMSMNWDKWNSLPDDIKKGIEDAAANVPDNSDWGSQDYIKDILPRWPNIEVVNIAPDEQERWKATQDPIQQEYMDMLKAKGVANAEQIFDRMNELLNTYTENFPSDPNP